MWSLDVSKCFDSIYTHTFSWAVKDKDFTKKNVKIESTFAQEFDRLMRQANHNETNGIVIGPEVSRIFSEIIFQRIDKEAISKLEQKENLLFSVDYAFRRYVDDVFIFAKNDSTAQRVYDYYADSLIKFNLHANTAKSVRCQRPFFTKKSRIIREISDYTNEFLEKFLIESDDKTSIIPKEIHFTWKLTRSYIRQLKSTCSYNEVGYDEVSSYLISVFTERVKKLANIKTEISNEEQKNCYRDATLVLLDILYFLYSVAPSVGASYKLCTSVIVLIKFSKKYLKEHSEAIKQRIFELTDGLLTSEMIQKSSEIDGFVSLEAVNVVLATRELEKRHLLPEEKINNIFPSERKLSYFEIISCLFYIRDELNYKKIKRKIIRHLDSAFSELFDIFQNSEKACLFLDIMRCPYIPQQKREVWLKNLYASLNEPVPTTAEISQFLAPQAEGFWFVNWDEVDLLNALEKKELKQAY